MSRAGLTAASLRASAGTLGGVLLGLAAFRGDVLRPAEPEFQCVAVSGLMALILAIVRAGRPGWALLVAGGFGILQLGLSWQTGLPRSALLTAFWVIIAGGLVLIAVIFDLLGQRGIWLGKFLVAGPLLGGVYLAASPLAGWGLLSAADQFENFIANVLLGIVIGDGVGLGVELVELLPALAAEHPPVAEPAAHAVADQAPRPGRPGA